jgi:hypothetical protein
MQVFTGKSPWGDPLEGPPGGIPWGDPLGDPLGGSGKGSPGCIPWVDPPRDPPLVLGTFRLPRSSRSLIALGLGPIWPFDPATGSHTAARRARLTGLHLSAGKHYLIPWGNLLGVIPWGSPGDPRGYPRGARAILGGGKLLSVVFGGLDSKRLFRSLRYCGSKPSGRGTMANPI